MAFTHVGSVQAGGQSSSPSITHGLSISSGDLVVAYLNVNSAGSITANAGTGASWTEAVNQSVASETAQEGLFWKIASATEPATMTFSISGSRFWNVMLKVFSSATDAVVDAAANSARRSTAAVDLVCIAANGETVSDGSVSIIGGSKDNRNGLNTPYNTANNSYLNPVGNTEHQAAAMAHRIFVTGTTIAVDVTLGILGTNDAMSDNTYSTHISFVEGVSGSVGSASGSSTASGTGSSTHSATGSSTGSSAASATGASTYQADGSSAGVATVTGTGAAEFAGTGSSTGSATVSGVGSSSTGSIASATGSSTVSGVGESTSAGTGSSAGVATVSGVGASSNEAAGSSAGSATVSGVGTSIAAGESVGSSAGSSTVSGVGASTHQAVGSASGIATVSGVGTFTGTVSAVGSASGSSTVSGISGTESEQPTGGWWFDYEKEVYRREKERRKREKLKAEAEKISDKLERELAIEERKIEEEDFRLAELQRLTKLAKKHEQEINKIAPDRVILAAERAIIQGNYSAMEALEREMSRLKEEEDFLIQAVNLIMAA